jgi:hypothetical protein
VKSIQNKNILKTKKIFLKRLLIFVNLNIFSPYEVLGVSFMVTVSCHSASATALNTEPHYINEEQPLLICFVCQK